MKKEEKELIKLIAYIDIQERYISSKIHSLWMQTVKNKTQDIFYPVGFWNIQENLSERGDILNRYINYWKGIKDTEKANEYLDYIEGKQRIKFIRKFNIAHDTKQVVFLNKIDMIFVNNKIKHLSIFGKKFI